MGLIEREETLIDHLMSIVEQPYTRRFEELKRASGKKLVGCLPMHVPEELVDAAGMIPVLIMESTEPVAPGKEYVQGYFCSPVRDITTLAAVKQLTMLDGVIVPNTCHEMRGLKDVMQRHSGIGWVRGLYLPPPSPSRPI